MAVDFVEGNHSGSAHLVVLPEVKQSQYELPDLIAGGAGIR
jgi:hypothetical protein